METKAFESFKQKKTEELLNVWPLKVDNWKHLSRIRKCQVIEILDSVLQNPVERIKEKKSAIVDACDCPYYVLENGYYPGFSDTPTELTIMYLDDKFSYRRIYVLLHCVFQTTDRVLLKTSTENLIVFHHGGLYYIYNGCTCNLNRFKYMDLGKGTAGFILAPKIDDVVDCIKYFCYKKHSIQQPPKSQKDLIQEILAQYT